MRNILFIVFTSLVLAFGFNALSPKGLSLIRRTTEKIAVSDSALFGSVKSGSDTLAGGSVSPGPGQQNETAGIKVIAPLHERALAHPESASAISADGGTKDLFRIISLKQFRQLMKEARPLIFDARDSASYIKGHVKGARNADGLQTDAYFEKLVPIPKDTLVIIYCNNPECHLGRMLSDFMGALGFTNLLLYDDGWDGWEKARMPVDTSIVSW